MIGTVTVLTAGLATPAPPKAPVSTTPASGRPPQLDDRDWLARRYAQDGDMTIAIELGVNRKTVRRARERLRIETAPEGRRRGVAPARVITARPDCAPSEVQIAARIQRERRAGGPSPSLGLVAARVRALHEAQADPAAFRDALVSLGAACGLVLDHGTALEAA